MTNWLGYFVPLSIMTAMMKEVMVVTKEVMVVVIMQSKRLAATE